MTKDLTKHDGKVSPGVTGPEYIEHVEAFDSLKAGLYWRALEDIEDGDQGFKIAKDTVLLIESIRLAEFDEIHTIVVRPHPSIYQKGMRSYRFLVNDFLCKFVYEPDAEKIRAQEINDIQNDVEKLNTELVEAQTNPNILEAVVKKELESRKSESSTKNEKQLPAIIDPRLMPTTVDSAIVSGLSTQMVDGMKLMAERHKDVAVIKASWMQAKTTEIALRLQAMTPFFTERAAAALAKTDDVQRNIGKMQRGIETLYLYTGENVVVETIRKGKSAPNDLKLSVCARKLFIDEEVSIYLDVDEWFDFRDIGQFDQALNDHPELVNQIFPTERCVLVMAVTKRDINYGCFWTNEAFNKENQKVFMMVRDGENLFRIFSPVESHLASANLFPSQKQMDQVFKRKNSDPFSGLEFENITFNDIAYTDALQDHELMILHYKRFMVLIAGLDAREKLFGEFYPGDVGFGFISLAFQNAYMNFIDDETHVFAEKSLPVASWIKKQNQYMQSGSRVLVKLRSVITPESAPGAFSYSSNHSSRYDSGHTLNYKVPFDDYQEFVVFNKGGQRMIKVLLEHNWNDNLRNIYVNLDQLSWSRFGTENLPMICLDRLKIDEINHYIHSRDSRKFHLSFIRTLKRARDLVIEIREQERDFRQVLSDSIVDGGLSKDQKKINLAVDETIYAWRAFNRGKSVENIRPNDKKAWSQLLDFAYFFCNQDHYIDQIKQEIVQLGYTPLRVVLTGIARFKVYYAPKDYEKDDRLIEHSWVHRSSVRLNKTKAPAIEPPTWVKLARNHAAELALINYEEANFWVEKNNPFGKFEDKTSLIDAVDNWSSLIEQHSLGSGEISRKFVVQALNYHNNVQMKNKSGYVVNTTFVFPIGIRLTEYKKLRLICISTTKLLPCLYHLVADESLKEEIKNGFVKWYKNKTSSEKTLHSYAKKSECLFELIEIHAPDRWSDECVFTAEDTLTHGVPWSGVSKIPHPSLWVESAKEYEHVYLPAELQNQDGLDRLDSLLGCKKPSGFDPHQVMEYKFRIDGKYVCFVDILPVGKLVKARDAELHYNAIEKNVSFFPSRKEALEYVDGKGTWEPVPDDSDLYHDLDGLIRYQMVDEE